MSGVPSSSGFARLGRQPRLDVLHALEAEPADQATGEAGQARDRRHAMLRAQALDFGEGVVDLAHLDEFAVLGREERIAREGVHAPRRAGR